MFGLGKCKHEFKNLAVYKKETVEPSEKYPRDYNHVTYHLFCRKCGAGNLETYGTEGALSIKYAQTIRSTNEVVAEMVEDMKREELVE